MQANKKKCLCSEPILKIKNIVLVKICYSPSTGNGLLLCRTSQLDERSNAVIQENEKIRNCLCSEPILAVKNIVLVEICNSPSYGNILFFCRNSQLDERNNAVIHENEKRTTCALNLF
ncbi:hypothetical protein AVEN_264286-1 [Araneus ventricosus]|uniref:Uncharacterized protein n=1 Tax=Araneus ventricosus TaxID=182803 RepID=A0A4Y2LBR9_ARAVE|nr:hypothetical protein AVEN_264286-1 [Araneus ventricosus]